MSDDQRPEAGGQRGASDASNAPRVRAGIPVGQSLFEYVASTYGTTSIPQWRALERGSERIATLQDAERLAYLVDLLIGGNWHAYELLRCEHALVADLGLELLRRRGTSTEDVRQVARALVLDSMHVEPCLVGATLLRHIAFRDDLDLMRQLGAQPAFSGVFLMFVFAVFTDRAEARSYLHSVRSSIHGLELMIDQLDEQGYL
jgi:hypothetical protein